ncbi:MAG: flippase-like domain-containing protein [bacterium]|nr:flippase-like domain-containing protein [bacterium]
MEYLIESGKKWLQKIRKNNGFKQWLIITVKTSISLFFIVLVMQKIDFSQLSFIMKNISVCILLWMLLINYLITFFIALRWYFILDDFKKEISFLYVWKLSLIGLYFNVLLPTGTGGDAVKILYITRGRKEKLKLGTSVLFDRFIGSSTIVVMAIISLLSYEKNLPAKLKIVLLSLLILVLFIWLLILWDKLAILVGKIFPAKLRQKLKAFYSHLRNYGIKRRVLIKAIFASVTVQILSIYIQYFAATFVSLKGYSPVPFPLFFVFIPIIWLSAIVPSIGGLGIREYGYLFFFQSYMGKDSALAMALINLMLILTQALLGALIFLFFRQSHQSS